MMMFWPEKESGKLTRRMHQQSNASSHTEQWCEDCIPSARHCSACELIHNDDLLPAGDVVDVLDLQFLRLESIDEVARPLLPGIIQV